VFGDSVAFVGDNRWTILPIAFEGRICDALTDLPITNMTARAEGHVFDPRVHVGSDGRFFGIMRYQARLLACNGVLVVQDDLLRDKHVTVELRSEGYEPTTIEVVVYSDGHSYGMHQVRLKPAPKGTTATDESDAGGSP
jgi:hypothetical protein